MATTSIPGTLSLTGIVVPFAGKNPPSGWLECDGRAVNRILEAKLFNIIGDTFGKGDGSNTFNLPDLRGEFIRGWDHERGIDPERKLGHSQEDQLQTHRHLDSGHTHQDGGHNHTDSGHTHADSGHNHVDNGHNHSDSGHSHADAGHAHPHFHFQKIAAVADGDDLTDWDGKGNHRADGRSTAHANIQTSYANIQSANANIQPAHANIEVAQANIQPAHAAIESAQANIGEPVDARHGAETRPRNVALMYIIKT
ncbi:MAG: phage Tail Collar Domain protein [Gammaproteobacteria bacterium]|jgi:microcystin-dependent protein|nr:phage Tail Collar Domain protein [Gammaproteobacteria bacterium]